MFGPEGGAGAGAGSDGGNGGGPDPSAFVRNLRVPMPAGRKIRLVVRNNALKIARLQSCCGHPGEPGC